MSELFSIEVIYMTNPHLKPNIRDAEWLFYEYLCRNNIAVKPLGEGFNHLNCPYTSISVEFLILLGSHYSKPKKLKDHPREVRDLTLRIERIESGKWTICLSARLKITGGKDQFVEKAVRLTSKKLRESSPTMYFYSVLFSELNKGLEDEYSIEFSRERTELLVSKYSSFS